MSTFLPKGHFGHLKVLPIRRGWLEVILGFPHNLALKSAVTDAAGDGDGKMMVPERPPAGGMMSAFKLGLLPGTLPTAPSVAFVLA